MTGTDMAQMLLAPEGVLKAAINLGNAALAQRDETTGALGGVTVALAQAMAKELGAEAAFEIYTGAGKVTDATDSGVWSIAFLAIDPERAKTLAYSPAYVQIESTWAVPVASSALVPDDLDKPGQRLVVAKGSAYDLYLTPRIRNAQLVRAPTPPESFAEFRNGGYDAVAGVRQSLEKAFRDDPSIRIMEEPIIAILQAVAVSRRHEAALPWLATFIERMKANGFVRAALDASGKADVAVAA